MAGRTELTNIRETLLMWVFVGTAAFALWQGINACVDWTWTSYLWFSPVASVLALRAAVLGLEFSDHGLIVRSMIGTHRIAWDQLAEITYSGATVGFHTVDGRRITEYCFGGSTKRPFYPRFTRGRAERVAQEAFDRTGVTIPLRRVRHIDTPRPGVVDTARPDA
jgi:hypothetical protein